MAVPKTFSGARAKVFINGALIGIFTNVSYGVQYDTSPVYILGRLSPAEIDYTAQEPVSISASGWRVYGKSATTATIMDGSGGPGVPKLQELLSAEYATFEIYDRLQAGDKLPIAKIDGVRYTGYSTSIAARQLTEMSLTFTGMLLSDEDGASTESASATHLP